MSTKLLQITNLGSLSNITFVAKTVASSSRAVPIKDLKKYCVGRSIDLAYSIDGVIELLTSIHWLKSKGSNLSSDAQLPRDLLKKEDLKALRKTLILDVFSLLKEQCILQNFIDLNSFDYDIQTSRITIFRNSIPLTASGLKNLLISIKFLIIDPNQPHIYYVDNDYQVFIETEVIEWLSKYANFTIETGLSFEKFKEIQKSKEEAGLRAEEYVLSFEKKRLEGHPLVSHVKLISRIKVDAGYDIISFDSLMSKEPDRFIEVKSFFKLPEFYWSKNELTVSEVKRKKYFLYLIDRSKIDNPNYQPTIVQDPFINIFQNSGWDKNPQNWLISPSRNN
ncbi:MAG: DUF3883 domain-containing protein [Anaerolineales bacterium]|nr:DUF3883 domain-containing protein [Anaerolineales bacterium]